MSREVEDNDDAQTVKAHSQLFCSSLPYSSLKKRTGPGGRLKKPDYDRVPTACFVQPPLASCGLTEEEVVARVEAAKKSADCDGEKASAASSPSFDIFVSKFRPMRNTLSGKNESTFMKMIVDSATDEVVGCHMVRVFLFQILSFFPFFPFFFRVFSHLQKQTN